MDTEVIQGGDEESLTILKKPEYGLLFKVILEGNHTPTDIYKTFKENYSKISYKECPSYDELVRKLGNITSKYFNFLTCEKPGRITKYNIYPLGIVKYLIAMISIKDKEGKLVTFEGWLESTDFKLDPEFKSVQKSLLSFMEGVYIKDKQILILHVLFNSFLEFYYNNTVPDLLGRENYYETMAKIERDKITAINLGKKLVKEFKHISCTRDFYKYKRSIERDCKQKLTDTEFRDVLMDGFSNSLFWAFSGLYIKRKIAN